MRFRFSITALLFFVALGGVLCPVDRVLAAIVPMDVHFSMPPLYPGWSSGPAQTALKTGDSLWPYALVVAEESLTLTPDFSALGLSASSVHTSSGPYYGAIGNSVYSNVYRYDFGTYQMPALTDGVKLISISGQDAFGKTAFATTSVVVDNTPPVISLTNITFSTTSPKTGDYMYLTGKADGTGSVLTMTSIAEFLYDAQGKSISTETDGSAMNYGSQPLVDAIATSTDGSFVNFPIQIFESNRDWEKIDKATSLSIRLTVLDGAGNTATTSLTVPIPKTPPTDPCATPGACTDNVLFIPGTEASRLYYRDGFGIEHQVWEPDFYTDIPYLAMNADGTSKYALYTKDIIDSMESHNPFESTIAREFGDNLDMYGGFEKYMNDLVASGTLKEWRAYPYDWRYDVHDVVTNGSPTEISDGSIKQEYLADILMQLASTSPTGKVTIVAHSNGGLVAKELALKLGSNASKYIDRIITVGTPQWGTPSAIGIMLHGDGQTELGGLIMRGSDVRAVTEGIPNAYDLLPSPAYFAHISDPAVAFDASGSLSGLFAKSFGTALTSFAALTNFLEDSAGLDAQTGSSGDLRAPIPLSSTLVDKAMVTHTALDAWIPPSGILLTSIAGWGQDTVKGLTYTTAQKTVCNDMTAGPTQLCTEITYLEHTPILTQDGDNTVVSPSAIGNTADSRYFNTLDFVHDKKENIVHQNLTSATPIQKVITDFLTSVDPSGESYMTTSKPVGGASPVQLRISTHSPVDLLVTDASGNQSGIMPMPGTDFAGVKRDIPGSSVQVFDDEEYVTVPQTGVYQVQASGYADGSATLQTETIESNGEATTTALFANIPTTASSTVTLTATGNTITTPVVDLTGDGTADFMVASSAAGAYPLAYAQSIATTVNALDISDTTKRQLIGRLMDIEKLIAPNKGGRDDKGRSQAIQRELDNLERFVTHQVRLAANSAHDDHGRHPQKGIGAHDAEIILGMINQLKPLL